MTFRNKSLFINKNQKHVLKKPVYKCCYFSIIFYKNRLLKNEIAINTKSTTDVH